jgi:hypothetical protein
MENFRCIEPLLRGLMRPFCLGPKGIFIGIDEYIAQFLPSVGRIAINTGKGKERTIIEHSITKKR